MDDVMTAPGPKTRRPLGDILVQSGKLRPESIARILEHQNVQQMSFGEAAVDLGLVTQDDLVSALSEQFGYAVGERAGSERLSERLVLLHEPFSATAEALRLLRTQVALRRRQTGFRGLTIMAATQGVGSTFFASNLALAMSQIQVRTLLIDANMRDPSIERVFGLPPRAEGLSSILSGAVRPERAIYHERLPYLSIIPAGPTPPNPQELLSGSLFQSLTVALMRDFDFVIADTPAANSCADAFAVTAALSQVLVVAQRNSTHVRDIAILTQQVQAAGGAVLGSVLNDE
jgi:protein-tyrosine kinase